MANVSKIWDLNALLKLTDKNQNSVWQAEQKGFEFVVHQQDVKQPLRFPGQIEDTETGFYYNYHRYYNPEIGRYTQPDPIGLAGGINPYVYASNNPIMNMDPSGLMGIRNHPIKTGNGIEARYYFEFTPISSHASDWAKRLHRVTRLINRLDPSWALNPKPASANISWKEPIRALRCDAFDSVLESEFEKKQYKNPLTDLEAKQFLQDMVGKYPDRMSEFYDEPNDLLDTSDENARKHWWNQIFYPNY